MSVQERVRYHEYMRPRFSNPTFSSSNVGSTIGSIFSPNIDMKSSNLGMQRRNSLSKLQPSQNRINSQQLVQKQTRGLSRLSNYGTSSLNSLHKAQFPKGLNERDIYEKQAKKYNIISMHPISHQETIKKYPKYHLQDMDTNYYKKMELEYEYNRLYNSKVNQTPRQEQKSTNPQIGGQPLNKSPEQPAEPKRA